MTIETYYNFLTIVECGNINAASEKLLIAQPALSTQLKNLENTLGVKLLERTPKQVKLTPAGELFYKKAQVICSVNDDMHSELSDFMLGRIGSLKISMTPSSTDDLLHSLFDNFVNNHPHISLQFIESLSPQVAENVKNGISEIGLIRSAIRNADEFDIIPYRSEELMVIISKDNPLSKKKKLSLKDIKNQPIATTDVIAPILNQAFRSINTIPNYYLLTSMRKTATFWVNNYKNCIAILPCSLEDQKNPGPNNVAIPISDYDFSVTRSFITYKGRELSPIAKEFLSSVRLPQQL